MNEQQEKKYWGKLPELMLCLLLIIVATAYIYKKPVSITTAQCPNPVVEKQVEQYKMDDWECEKEGHTSDLLQPSGLWVNQDFDCWKLEMNIKQYCNMYECPSIN